MSYDAAIPIVEDRVNDFGYGYRIVCICGGTSHISADIYYAEPDQAHVPCQHCSRLIHFGPAVAALRDVDDPTLDNAQINKLAWYHTSTSSEWPVRSRASTDAHRAALADGAHRLHLPAEHVEHLIDRELNKALHIGTYEAAIENMLRRIRDQRDDQAAFYIHRVALKICPNRINDGYRDENHDPAAQLTTMELRNDGLDAVRYLNVKESVGSISLAVLPETIAWVQTISLPVVSLTPVHRPTLARLLDNVQGELDVLRTTEPDTSALRPHELRLMQLHGEPGPGGIAAASAAHSRKVGELHSKVTVALEEEYLAGISPVVSEVFERAITWRSTQTARQFADFFTASAAALTRPREVIALLARQEPRTAESGGGKGTDHDLDREIG